MDALTPTPAAISAQADAASAALKALGRLHTTLTEELRALPQPSEALLNAIQADDSDELERETTAFLETIDAFWSAASAQGNSRQSLFAISLQQALQQEIALKIHDRDLWPDVAMLVTAKDSSTVRACSLHIRLGEQAWIEIKGALFLQASTGPGLLALPGMGLTQFADQQALITTVVQWLNDDALCDALFINADCLYRDAVRAILDDPDLHLETFTATDIKLVPITGDPYAYAVSRQLDKQRQDIRSTCIQAHNWNPDVRAQALANATEMPGLFGPAAMLARREQAQLEVQLRASWPYWMKLADTDARREYQTRITRYDDARQQLNTALNGATSPSTYARLCVQTRLANDHGYDLDPSMVTVSTERQLPVTGETYTASQSLTLLALYGLHSGDRLKGSDFLTRTVVSIDGVEVSTRYPQLTPDYLADLIEPLDARSHFGEYQRTQYGKPVNQALMAAVIRHQVSALGYAANMQGHLTDDDFSLLESISNAAGNDALRRVQLIRLNQQGTLGNILVFRKEDATGQVERLIMFTADAPRNQVFQAFNNEDRLRDELVRWSADPLMSDYLLGQMDASNRQALRGKLNALAHLPERDANFVQLLTQDAYDTALNAMVDEHVRITLADQKRHTPDWYVQASTEQRQQLVKFENDAAGALRQYEAQSHTQVQPFEAYVRERASQKLNQLLGASAGTVDPDSIVITSPRQTLTYTQMVRDGYDDSLDFINESTASTATFSGPEGVDLSPLTPAIVAGSVRGNWLADEYSALVKRTLLDPQSPGYEYRRTTSLLITQLQMQAAALRSLVQGHISPIQYQWLATSIENLDRNDSTTRERYPVHPLQIHVDKPFIGSGLPGIDQIVIPDTTLIHVETVQGCFALLPTEIRLAALLYTPQAPDSIEFRLFSRFTESLQNSGMIDYYKDRCRIAARRTLSFFLNDMKNGKADKAPFLTREPIADLREVCFNRVIERKLRDVDDTTTSRSDMLTQLAWTSVEIIATALTLPFPPASFAVGAALSLRDTLLAVKALASERPEDANLLILASIFNALGAAGDAASGLKGFGGIVRKLEARSPRHTGWTPLTPDLQSMDRAVIASLDEVLPDRAVALALPETTPGLSGHATGVRLENGRHCITMNNQTYQVQYDARLRCWNIVDPANPFAFFGRQPVRLNDDGNWVLLDRTNLRGGGLDDQARFTPLQEQPSHATVPSADILEYELPAHLQPAMTRILATSPQDPTGLGMEEYFELVYGQARHMYTSLREKLYRDAQAFFLRTALPPRPTLPDIRPSTTLSAFLENAFSHSNGLVLSESIDSVASKRLLLLNMPLLAQQRVEVLYIEHLFTDKHLSKLAKYKAQGSRVRTGSHEIKDHLEYLNDGALSNQSREYDYYHLIKQAHRHNIEVRPFSSSVSYPMREHPVVIAAEDNAAAQKMSNFFGHKLISGDVAAQPTRRWVALLDHKLATTHDDVPGIAELQGAISVEIKDVPAGRVTRIRRTPASASAEVQPSGCDFKIEFANPHLTEPPSIAAVPTALDNALRQQLDSAAMGGTHTGDHGFHWDADAGWQRVDAEDWLPESPPTALQQSFADPVYEVSVDARPTVHELAHFKRKGLDWEYHFEEPELESVRSEFFARRQQLEKDARSILTTELPPRPTMPVLTPHMDPQTFIRTLYEHTDGMVIGEFHDSLASKKLIIDNLPLLAEQNVKTLYMEHLLTDLHQTDLDRFIDTGQMSKRLLHDLKTLDQGHVTDPDGVYTFEKLVINAREHGLEVRAIDCAASYYLKGLSSDSFTGRQQMMNYFASRTIRRHQAVMGTHRWVALVGNSHSNTYADLVPGLAELEGGIGLRVLDVSVGTSRGITLDPGERVRIPLRNREEFLKGDFRVELEVRRSPAAIRPPQPLTIEDRLSRPGMFLTEQQEGGAYVIIHRSRDNEIHHTPVRLNAVGNVFVERPSWTAIHRRPYEDMDALVLALEDINLTRVG
ncbi:C-terminal region of Pasteurella multocida toxin residues 569-1285 [Pseudomonas sp. NFACC02]|uniref:membrane-targeted effector domain-containing toxin n=1 Tax=Pseudomonas sp. NFACC02 TaxID=1566250 RepID=UPI0008D5C022|nr:membrane-targeted effector domain-containing toxin [Pseudomonas sp. NFACC02]SER01157.1 C-terminal region of Pasteurella multocida toxin residues 569-1285 [Pseudomonas sp. NFACC02]